MSYHFHAHRWPLLVALLLILFCLSCSKGERIHKETRPSLYTIVTVTVSSASEEQASKAISSAFKEMERVAALLNYYSPESEISQINKNAGIRPVKISPETLELMDKAVFAAKATDGAFDVTMGPVIRLWDFRKKELPDGEKLKEGLSRVGYSHIIIDRDNSKVFLDRKGMEINLGGIMKGYLADKGVEALKKEGIRAGIIAIGGDIRAFGKKPDGEAWRVGIQNPRQKSSSDEIIATIGLSDMAISTAGDYEKSFEKDGKRYHHILDPKTGYPAYGCRSVTVIARDGVIADGIDTGLFIVGPQRAMEIMKEIGLEGVVIDDRGSIGITEGIKKIIQFQ
ncbi:MAG: FAD:protein FMN transferase [Nitrospirales bacterium]|nr:FAD:protein FMN transferase [Nitrospirales bacterium]